jgi:FtsH-binding integral membrane protein
MLKPHRGAVILAFGILGLVVCHLFGVAARVMGNNDLREMDQGYMDTTGRDLTTTGRILGMVATGLMVTSFIVISFFVLIPMVVRALH